MNTPLLAAKDPHAVPSLSSNGAIVMEEPESTSRLTQILRDAGPQPTPPTIAFHYSARDQTIKTTRTRQTTTNNNKENNFTHSGQGLGANPSEAVVAASLNPTSILIYSRWTSVSWLTVVAGSCTVVFMGLLWGSYLSSWFDVYLSVSIWNQSQRALLSSLDLAEVVKTLVSSRQYLLVLILAISTIVIPCMTMILHPIQLHHRHITFVRAGRVRQRQETSTTWSSAHTPWIKWAFFPLMVWFLLDLVLSQVKLLINRGSVVTQTDVLIQNEIGQGLMAYCIGLLSALVGAILLQVILLPHPSTSTTETTTAAATSALQQEIEQETQDTNHFVYMRILEEEPSIFAGAADEDQERQEENDLYFDETIPRASYQYPLRLTWTHRIMVFESGILSLLALIASFMLPLCRLEYSGLVTDYMLPSQTTTTLYLYDLPHKLLSDGDSNDEWFRWILCIVFVLQLFVLPIIAMFLAICGWYGRTNYNYAGGSNSCLSVVKLLFPACGGLTFGVALIVMMPSLHPIVKYFIQEQAGAVCNNALWVSLFGQDSCLSVQATSLAGAYAFALHAFCLEFFILLTLSWKSSRFY